MPYIYVKQKKKSAVVDGRLHWHEDIKNKALALRSQGVTYREIATTLGVSIKTIESWKDSDWWKQGLKDIQNDDYTRLDKKLTDILEATIKEIQDRVVNGDAMYDPRSGKVKRVPVKMRDLNTAMSAVIDRRQVIRNLPSKIVENVSQTAQLANLAMEFAKFVSGKEKDPLAHNTFELIEGETVVQNDEGEWVMHVHQGEEHVPV